MAALTGGAVLLAFAVRLGAVGPLTQILRIPAVLWVDKTCLRKVLVVLTLLIGLLVTLGKLWFANPRAIYSLLFLTGGVWGLDFLFVAAFLPGQSALHRLLAIREEGEVEECVVVTPFYFEVRKRCGRFPTWQAYGNSPTIFPLVVWPGPNRRRHPWRMPSTNFLVRSEPPQFDPPVRVAYCEGLRMGRLLAENGGKFAQGIPGAHSAKDLF